MPLLADFHADLDDDQIRIPADALASIRRAGGGRLRVTIETAAGDPEALAARGIDQETVDRVADVQKFERDLAALVLSGEGFVKEGPLRDRLEKLVNGGIGGSDDRNSG
ncbi:MAG: hypothetical protein H7X80_11420 [bacterium]|nr:hypothetical protein [Candidatus Kapabacteria bacterium]